jgi:hypothetical protein
MDGDAGGVRRKNVQLRTANTNQQPPADTYRSLSHRPAQSLNRNRPGSALTSYRGVPHGLPIAERESLVDGQNR